MPRHGPVWQLGQCPLHRIDRIDRLDRLGRLHRVDAKAVDDVCLGQYIA